MAIDLSSILASSLDSKITAMLYKKLYQGSSVAVPDSTRRAFDSQMRTGARVAAQGAQNMQDAAHMVEVAQTDVTSIKNTLNQMKELAAEMSIKNGVPFEQYQNAKERLKKMAESLVSTAKNSSFNGISLLDGKAGVNKDGKISLQAGGNARDQVLTNFLDAGDGSSADILSGSGNLNLDNLVKQIDAMTFINGNEASAQKAFKDLLGDDTRPNMGIQATFDRVQGIEAQYSYDIKSLNNMSIYLLAQGDILEATQSNSTQEDDEESSDSTTKPGAKSSGVPSYMDMIMGNGKIISGIG